MARRKGLIVDPAASLNEKILADRQRRIIDQEAAESIDLGLRLQEPEPETAAEFLRDEWDKKSFGDSPKVTTRVVYGPDPLVSGCPEFHERLEKYGQEEVAGAFRELITQKGELAIPDPIMRKGVRKAIERFGKEATAEAFYDRIMRIPSRTVEVELDGALDPLLSNPMRELVDRYGQPGMAVKFLSERCIQVLGKRGYEIVKDENGDPVKCGTLLMGVIPEAWAERRRQHWADQSQSLMKEQEEQYFENTAKLVRDSGISGLSPLSRGESVRADYVDTGKNSKGETRDPFLEEQYGGSTRTTGVRID